MLIVNTAFYIYGNIRLKEISILNKFKKTLYHARLFRLGRGFHICLYINLELAGTRLQNDINLSILSYTLADVLGSSWVETNTKAPPYTGPYSLSCTEICARPRGPFPRPHFTQSHSQRIWLEILLKYFILHANTE